MATQRWNPFLRDFVSLRDAVDRLFEESFVHPDRLFSAAAAASRQMPLEIYETPEELVVRALIPGVPRDQLDVQYQDGTLTLRAKTQPPAAHDDWTWHVREYGYGETVRTMTLPKQIDADSAEATFTDGVLTLTLPKAASARPRSIRIAEGPSARQIGSGETSTQTASAR
jgi:HSP20 family protein